jgi:CRISPR-associated protein Cmr4
MPDAAPYQAARLLFLHAQTAIHPGSGTALGTVDLPVQRERHTHWPTVPGSALKGILRDRCRETAKQDYQDEYEERQENGQTWRALKRTQRRVANEDNAELVAAFGPGGKIDESNAHAGALSVTDARILAFPVRSLKGVFAWVTCPAVLDRLNRDLKLAGLPALSGNAVPQLQKTATEDQAACAKDSPLLVDGNKLVLEEFEFARIAEADALVKWVAARATPDSATQTRLRSHLAVLHDDDFGHFVRHATEVVARVALDYERKTVKQGALFYQEFLPAETLFYSLVLATGSRYDKYAQPAMGMLDYLARHLPENSVLQIGGDETTGKGLCLVRLSDGKEV